MPAADGEELVLCRNELGVSEDSAGWRQCVRPTGLRVGFLGQALWCKPVILGALHSEAGGCQGQGLPVLYIEFMACLDNLARPCLKIQKLGGVWGYSSRPWAPMPKTYLFIFLSGFLGARWHKFKSWHQHLLVLSPQGCLLTFWCLSFLPTRWNSQGHHSHLTTTTDYAPYAFSWQLGRSSRERGLVIMENSLYSILSLAWDARTEWVSMSWLIDLGC